MIKMIKENNFHELSHSNILFTIKNIIIPNTNILLLYVHYKKVIVV